MLKKIAMGALLTGLVGVLILGAVNRTNAVSGGGAGETGRRGRTAETITTEAGVQNYAQRAGAANEFNGQGGRWAQEAAAQGAATTETLGRGGGWAQGAAGNLAPTGQGAGTLGGVPAADVQPDEWRTIEGTVISAADDLVEIGTAAGEIIPFEGRPLSFALEQGFSLQAGDTVAVDGFDEDGEFKIGKVTNLGNEASVTLRDASGRPGWSGRGWRS